MSKKTRREKILSQERKKKKLLELVSYAPSTGRSDTKLKTPIKIKRENEPSSQPITTTQSYFLQDFRKSLIFIALIIALEILIYFGTINNLGTIFNF